MVEGPTLHIVSSMIAGFMAALTTSPVDVIKTRIMNQSSGGINMSALFVWDRYKYVNLAKSVTFEWSN